MNETIKLTQTVQKGGCAAKVAAVELRQILSQVQFPPNQPDVIVDGHLMDDAAVIKINDTLAMIQTLDFFTPIVDSPRLFGQIASANALSDVYAMGAKPQTAMAILAFPIATLSQQVIAEVLQGAADKIGEAKASFVGGHSIDDDTLKFGLSVTGYAHPEKIWSNSESQEGDTLVLTKALGTGTATAALKRKEVSEIEIEEVLNSMACLNNILDELDESVVKAIHSATDVTGFGLAGHALNMARASQKVFDIQFQKIPLFKGTLDKLEKGFLTKAHRTNKEYVAEHLKTEGLSELEKLVLFDPQTSGGLLLSISNTKAQACVEQLKKAGRPAEIIGRVRSYEAKEYLNITQ